jgi:hypothetical protein
MAEQKSSSSSPLVPRKRNKHAEDQRLASLVDRDGHQAPSACIRCSDDDVLCVVASAHSLRCSHCLRRNRGCSLSSAGRQQQQQQQGIRGARNQVQQQFEVLQRTKQEKLDRLSELAAEQVSLIAEIADLDNQVKDLVVNNLNQKKGIAASGSGSRVRRRIVPLG